MPRRIPEQETLFGAPEPVAAARPAVRIQPAGGKARLGKRQKTFNNLVDRITRQNRKLQRWQDYLPKLAQRIESELQPELDTQRALQRRLALALGALLEQQGKRRPVANIYRQRVRSWMLALIDAVLDDGEPDPELTALRDRHGTGQDEVTRFEQALALRIAAAEFFDEELLEDIEADSGEELLQELERRLAAEADAYGAGDADFDADDGPDADRAAGPDADDFDDRDAEPTARSAARRADAERTGTDPLRNLFRRLASSLHPDRETDPETRTEKTALMQRANDAHERRDLLELLRLQLELEQIDPDQLAALPEDTLEHYISELKQQARKLDEELEDTIGHLRDLIPRARSFTPEEIDKSLDQDIARTRLTAYEIKLALDDLEQPKTRRKLFAETPKPDPMAEDEAIFGRLVLRLAELVQEYPGRA